MKRDIRWKGWVSVPSCLQLFARTKRNGAVKTHHLGLHPSSPLEAPPTLYPLHVRPAFLFAKTHFIRRKNDLSISYSASRSEVRLATCPRMICQKTRYINKP